MGLNAQLVPNGCLPTPPMRCGRFVRKIKATTTCTYYYKIKATTPHVLTIITALQFSYKPGPTMAFLSVFHSFPGFCWSRFCSCCLVLNLEPKYRFKRWFWINSNSNSVSNISQGWHCLTSGYTQPLCLWRCLNFALQGIETILISLQWHIHPTWPISRLN